MSFDLNDERSQTRQAHRQEALAALGLAEQDLEQADLAGAAYWQQHAQVHALLALSGPTTGAGHDDPR